MRKLLALFIILIISIISNLIVGQDKSLQESLDELEIGKTNLKTIEKLFGLDYQISKICDWYGGSFPINGVTTYFNYNKGGRKRKRESYRVEYSKIGISFYLFNEPWELTSYTIEHKQFKVMDIKIGDSLKKVEKRFGKGERYYTSEDNIFWVKYESKGIKFAFENANKKEKKSKKNARSTLVCRISKFNNRLQFLGGVVR